MERNDSNKSAASEGRSVSPDVGVRTLGWMFLKTVVFCAFVCVVVLGMAEFVTH